MPTLAASSSLFQFALGANAVMPVLLSDFHKRKEEAAEMVLRRLKELRPELTISEHSKPDFVDFAFKSSVGLRHAAKINLLVTVFSLLMCTLSLCALCLSAIGPGRSITTGYLLLFVAVTIVLAPSIYLIRNRYLSWIYRTLTVHGLRSDDEALAYSKFAEMHIKFQETFRQTDKVIAEVMDGHHAQIWSMKIARVHMSLYSFIHRLRSLFAWKKD